MKKDVKKLQEKLKEVKELLETSREKISDLSGLLEVSALVSSTLDLDKLLGLIMELSKRVTKARASTLMLIDEPTGELVWEIALGEKGHEVKRQARLKLGEGIAGWVAREGKPLLVPDVRKDPRFYSKLDKATGFKTQSILCVPMRVKGKTIGIIETINKIQDTRYKIQEVESFDHEDEELLAAFASQAAVAIENARMHQRILERQRVEKDLEVAHEIQRSFLPQTLPRVPEFDFAARNIPALEIGGDFYDFIELGEDRMGLVIGDVGARGVPAALYMAKAMNDFRSQALMKDTTVGATLEVAQVLTAANNLLVRESVGATLVVAQVPVSLSYLILQVKQKKMALASAGNITSISLPHGKERCKFLKIEGEPLGMKPNLPYQEREISLSEGDIVLLCTDGVIETKNDKNESFGLNRLKETILKYREKPISELVDQVLKNIEKFRGKTPQPDDITLLGVKVR